MKIALIHSTLDFSGGAERLVLYLAKELQNLGKEVDVYSISFNRDKCYPELNRGLNINSLKRDFPYLSTKSGLFAPYEFLLKIHYAIKLAERIDNKYDIINCHNFPSTITSVKIKEQSDMPVIWYCHEPLYVVKSNNPLFHFIKNYDRKVVEKIDEIVSYSYNSDSIDRLYNRKPIPIYSGVDIGRFGKGDKGKIKEKYGINDNVLLFVGQLAIDKRVHDLICALKIVNEKIPNTKLVIVGDGRYKDNLASMAHELKLKNNVIFTGFVDDEELPDYYASADIFLNPAVKQSWGLAPFEAMAAKTLTVVSSDTGAAQVIKENDIGVVLDPLQPELWAEKIIGLLENKEESEKMAEKGYRWVNENMSWEIFAKNMLNIFELAV